MRVADYAADWPYNHPRPTPETNRHYRQMVGKFVQRFGDRALTSVSLAELQVWAQENVSALRYVRAMFADAVADGYLAVNPAARVKVARAPRRRREEAVPALTDIEALLAAADPQMAAVVALGGYVGLRWSEILALGYGGFGPDLSTAYVHQQLARDNVTLKPIKGKVKARQVDVFRAARPHVERWADDDDSSELYVVGPLTHSELRSKWERLREACGLSCEFHQLRTFCATWLLELGASPLDVAIQLHGHTDPTVVLSYYAMVNKEKGLERLRRVVDGD